MDMLVGKHGIQTFEVVIVMLLLLLFPFVTLVPTSAHLLFIFGQVLCKDFVDYVAFESMLMAM